MLALRHPRFDSKHAGIRRRLGTQSLCISPDRARNCGHTRLCDSKMNPGIADPISVADHGGGLVAEGPQPDMTAEHIDSLLAGSSSDPCFSPDCAAQ